MRTLSYSIHFIYAQFAESFPTGSPEAWRTPDDAASRSPTKARHPARQKGRRCCQWQRRRGQEHRRRSVPTSLFSRVAIQHPLKVNLAFSIASRKRARVGVLDLDIFGPSVPKLLGLESAGEPHLTPSSSLTPLSFHACVTLAFARRQLARLSPSPITASLQCLWGFSSLVQMPL
jgi:hypothetical protein